jgi:hypothetical protein
MASRQLIAFSALAIVIGLAACAGQANLAQAQGPNASGIETTRLILLGNDGDAVLASGVAIRNVLKDFGGNTNPNNLGQLIQQIRNSNQSSGTDVPGTTGLGGAFGQAFLDLAEDAIAGNGQFDNGKRVVTSLSGQILDYAYNAADGSGKLEVNTYITSRVVPAGQGLPPPKTVAYKWKIRVDPTTANSTGFIVVDRVAGPQPFPNTISFTREMKQRVDSLGFMKKLWVKGTNIVVEEVRRDQNYNASNPNFQLLPPNNPNYAKLYQTDASSCIDMMFVGDPPSTMADLQAPPFYCLGRCDHPFIVNTR